MITIGRKDRIDLPELQLFDIEAKVDTGAYTSALHCHETQEVVRDGTQVLSFKVLDPEHPEFAGKIFYASKYSMKTIRSSTGVSEDRFAIETNIMIFGKERNIEFSLTDRSEMKYPILLGRKFLAEHYLVDVQLKDLSFKLKTEKK